ncbi:flavin monoamine oxidase family protein [Streptomyces spongiae]|uniref:flavin monoamine oxidase family protein n=1 Tax=Streptomyces spongiae TaxID=565072 RepID=UPI001883CB0B|nr:NAD(P)/FAD-dependent oxidoreductase [Streptomyces spongiae]
MIIGAGIAGLFTARRLHDAGEDVVVLEATQHIGGRTRGDRESLLHGAVADLGASFLDRGQDRLLAFCLEQGLALSPEIRMFPKGPSEKYSGASIMLGNLVLRGRAVSEERRAELAVEVQSALDAAPPTPAETIAAWGARVGLSDDAYRAYVAQAGFNPVHRETLTSSWHVHPGDIGRLCWVLADSTDAIAHAAARGLDVRVDQPVRLISRVGRSYRVVTDNDELVADDVVVTSSVTATRCIGFDPVLPAWKTEALLGTPMSQGGKIIGQYEDGSRILDGVGPSTMTDSPISMFWLRRTAHDLVTVLGVMPDTGDGLLDDQSGALDVLDRQIAAMTGTTPRRLAGVVYNWTRQEFFGGVVSLGTGGAARRAALAASIGGLHFAGEATSDHWTTAMEGAALSGERAADTILLKRRARQNSALPRPSVSLQGS